MYPGSVLVLCMCPDRRLGLRWPRSHPRQTTKTSPVPFFGRRRRRQVRTQNLSEPRSGSIKCEIHANTPKPQCSAYHRAALRFTLALASPSPSLRSTSASAWAALSPQRRARSQHPGKAGRSSTTTQLRKTDTLVAGSAHPGWRRHWCRPCAQIQSRFCAGVRTDAWICAGRRPQLPGTEKTLRPTRAHRGPQTAPCANVNGIAGPGAFYYTGRIPAANRRRRPDRITRSYTKCKPAEPRPVCTGAPASVCHW